MGKSHRNNNRFDDDVCEDTVWVALEEIYISDATWEKLLRRDGQQIDAMRDRFERGLDDVRVVLHYRASGGYTIEDGRHRVIAAKLAGIGFIEALVVGD